MELVSVVCAIIEWVPQPGQEAHILIAQRSEQMPHAGFWEFPGGKPEPGEAPEQALVREIEEELGLKVVPEFCLGEFDHSYGHKTIRLTAYVCRPAQLPPLVQPAEHSQTAWITPYLATSYRLLPADVPIAEVYRQWRWDSCRVLAAFPPEYAFPKGVSGFLAVPELGQDTFRKACEAITASGAYKLLAIAPAEAQPNLSYYAAFLEEAQTGRMLLLFGNRYAPCVAVGICAEGTVFKDTSFPWPPHAFDYPAAIAAGLPAGWVLLPPELLTHKVDADNELSAAVVQHLANEEFSEFAYWEPRVMADVAFNNWKKG